MKKEAPVRTELIFETEERDGQLVLTGYHGHKKTVVLPEDVTVVGMHAFRRCFSMEELILPSSVRVIEADFARIESLFHRIREAFPSLRETFTELSIGMSNDWTIATRHGATMVRIGTDIFGPREY